MADGQNTEYVKASTLMSIAAQVFIMMNLVLAVASGDKDSWFRVALSILLLLIAFLYLAAMFMARKRERAAQRRFSAVKLAARSTRIAAVSGASVRARSKLSRAAAN